MNLADILWLALAADGLIGLALLALWPGFRRAALAPVAPAQRYASAVQAEVRGQSAWRLRWSLLVVVIVVGAIFLWPLVAFSVRK